MFGRTFPLKNRHLAYRLVLPIVMLLFISACQPAATHFRAPNRNELNAFVKDQSITPIVDKLLDDSSVLLYENSTSFGYSILTVREPEGTLVANNASAAKSDQPILVLRQLTGARPFMAVVIQDAALLSETAAIEVFIDSQNRLTSTTNGQSGVILISHSPVKDWGTVTLYNAQGKILYRQDGHPVQQLRVENSGAEDISNLQVLFPGKTADAEAVHIEFGDVPAGEMTAYRDVPSGVYRYAAYEYTLDHRVVMQAVTDWVGESPMQGEKFTYRIKLDSKKEPGGQIQLIQVRVDKP